MLRPLDSKVKRTLRVKVETPKIIIRRVRVPRQGATKWLTLSLLKISSRLLTRKVV